LLKKEIWKEFQTNKKIMAPDRANELMPEKKCALWRASPKGWNKEEIRLIIE
jgi:hypothetical protein